MAQPDRRPIGVFDSGVGGLSTLKEIRALLPHEDTIYFADQGHVPYGPRPLAEIQGFVRGITRFFLRCDAKLIVIACNAASAAGLKHIREMFPQMAFVGMEPAVKPAAEKTRRGVIGVITTRATYQGQLFASVVDRFARGVSVRTQVCPDFVPLVESGKLDGPEVRQAAETYLRPLLDDGIDQLVLGCTHYPFLLPVIREIVGPHIEIVDPGPAVARQAGRLINGRANDAAHAGTVRYLTSGSRDHFLWLAERLVDEPVTPQQVAQAAWVGEDVEALIAA